MIGLAILVKNIVSYLYTVGWMIEWYTTFALIRPNILVETTWHFTLSFHNPTGLGEDFKTFNIALNSTGQQKSYHFRNVLAVRVVRNSHVSLLEIVKHILPGNSFVLKEFYTLIIRVKFLSTGTLQPINHKLKMEVLLLQ